MNVILLAIDEITGDQAARIDSADRRLPQLRSWLAWFAEHGEPLWVQSYLPQSNLEAQSEVIRFLIESARDFSSGTSLILTPGDVRGGILKHPYLRCLDEIILTLDPEQEEMSGTLFQEVEAYCAELTGQKQELNLWVKEGTNRGGHAQVQPWLRRNLESTNVFIAPYVLGRHGMDLNQGASEAPFEYLQNPPSCRLFDSSITIALNGRIIACPRHAGEETIIDLGNLFEDSPESVLVKRGRQARRQLSSTICRGCHLDGRFSWPDSRGETVYDLIQLGRSGQAQDMDEDLGRIVPYVLSELSQDAIERKLEQFRHSLSEWSSRDIELPAQGSNQPFVSIETPVIKGDWLIQCIESVLAQSSSRWHFSLLWDKGDELARRILHEVEVLRHPRLSVYYGEGLGIARARQFLTERSTGDYILPLDDDDTLAHTAVEQFLEAASQMHWAGIIRGRRGFIDSYGNAVKQDDWFPFEPRHYLQGMTCDVYNHCQPYLISRAAYARTTGWEGFPEFKYAGEDCDIFLKVEEVAEIELIEDVLYYYRINQSRTSLELGTEVAHEMWRRLADAALNRRGGRLRRTTDVQPFTFAPVDDQLTFPGEAQGIDFTSSEREGNPNSPDILFVTPQDGAGDLRRALGEDAPPYICIVEESVERPSRSIVDQLIRGLRAQDADLACPKILDGNGRLAGADPYFSANMLPSVRGIGEADRGQYDFDAAAAWLLPHLILVRTAVFRSIGDMDTTYSSSELRSADFCLRARGRGFRCAYIGSAAVVQQGGEIKSPPQDEIERFTERWGRSVHLLYTTEEIATA